jgi:tetratricopeptide (TPR) repeat protein
MVARAVRVFDPKVRCIQLRWVEAPYVRDGRIKLPERVLVWWRSDTLVEDAAKVLCDAPKIVHGLHLLDLDGDPGVEALGWLAPLKIRLLHKLTDALLESGIDVDPEPLIDAINDASARLVSPIDLLDFSERLVEARTSGARLEDAQADAIALVLAERMARESITLIDVEPFAAAMDRAAPSGLLPPDVHSLLLSRGLAEADPAARPPLLDWFAFPGVYARTLRRLQLHAISSGSPLPTAKPSRVETAVGHVQARSESFTRTADEKTLQSLEKRAEVLLDAVRQGEDRDWPVFKRAEAAALLRALAKELGRARGDLGVASLVEREAALLEVAAQLWEDAAQPGLAATAWLAAAELLILEGQTERVKKASRQAIELAGKTENKNLQARSFKILADVSVSNGDLGAARQAYDAALSLSRTVGDRRGEATILRSSGALAMRNGDFVAAKQAYDAGLSICRALGDKLGEANTLRSSGIAATRAGDLAAAKQSFDAALTLYRAVGGRLGEANTLRSAGALAMRDGDLATAKQLYDEALRLYRAVGGRTGEANTLRSAGALATRDGDFAAAKQAYGAALSLSRNVGSGIGEANAIRGLAVVYLLEGRGFAEALQTSYALAVSVHDHHGAVLSRAFLASADPAPSAAAELEDIAQSFSSLGRPWEASLSRALARLKAGEPAAAAALLRERPETSLLAQEILQATPEEAIKLLLPYMPIA